MSHGQQFGLALLVLAALTGAIGFAIVFHYASNERPVRRFAIVIDAGSTQTRSGLFTIELDTVKLAEWTDSEQEEPKGHVPLTSLLKVQQVGSCVNGGPLASLKSAEKARELVNKCVGKFGQRIKKLDFIDSNNGDVGDELEDELQSSDEFALSQHRVDSVTHLHLGATAGMRALEQVNGTRAREKIQWVESAIDRTGSNLTSSAQDLPHINKGFVGILSGSDEASLGWISMNFACEKLEARRSSKILVEQQHDQPLGSSYTIESRAESSANLMANRPPDSIGTLELGGASAQMAYEIRSGVIEDLRMESRQLELFNGRYQLATRSDLCLGMSQAALRLTYVLMHNLYNASSPAARSRSFLELESPCLQSAARISYSSAEVAEILKTPCLLPSQQDELADGFRTFLARKTIVRMLGTGDVDQCKAMLSNLVDPTKCSSYFALCPTGPNQKSPPPAMPFVTISGYNKALGVLNLREYTAMSNQTSSDLLIRDRLGGSAVEHSELAEETRKFCSIDVSEFPIKFPRMNRAYYAINCFQLVYINKLLINFYKFEPTTSWNQIRFLLFEPKEQPSEQTDKRTSANDISWTLGLLLNATNQQYSEPNSDVFFHHGASVSFVLRATLLLMMACVLLAICLLVFAMVFVRRRQRGGAYINDLHHHCCSQEPTGSVVRIVN